MAVTNVSDDVLFRRADSVVPPSKVVDEPVDVNDVVATAIANLASLGYRLDADLLKSVLCSANPEDYMSHVLYVLKENLGVNKKYDVMYPNFPRQIMEASYFELYLNALIHYYGAWIGARILPQYDAEARPALDTVDFNDLKVIKGFGLKNGQSDSETLRDACIELLKNLVASKTSWGNRDAEDFKTIASAFDVEDLLIAFSVDIPNKENLAHVVGYAYDRDFELFSAVINKVDTSTDVLRSAVSIFGGNPSLNGVGVDKIVFVSAPRRVRRILVSALENVSRGDVDRLLDDMMRNVGLWKLLLHSVHVGEFANSAPTVVKAANYVRGNGKFGDDVYRGFDSKVEKAISESEEDLLLNMLSTRPGVFARRLDKFLRSSKDPQKVVDAFAEVAVSVSTPVLWQLRNFYVNRALFSGKTPKIERSFIPKGSVANVKYAKNHLPRINKEIRTRIIEIIDAAINNVYSDRSTMGRVYIDPALKGFTIPFGMRSANPALDAVGRGTRLALKKDCDFVRLFIFWKDGASRTDIDLSAMFLDENFVYAGDVAYYNLKNDYAVHSGDITSAPHGASEFIDFDINRALENGNRYVALMVNSFTHQRFSSLPEVFAGAMERSGEGNSGEIFEARTVSSAFDVTADGTVAIPMLFDLKTREIIWTDISFNSLSYINNSFSNSGASKNMIKGLLTSTHSSLYDLFAANVAARGELVADSESADTVISAHRGKVLFNSDKIDSSKLMSEWL